MSVDKKNNIWKAEDGTKYKVEDMTSSHIQNCINFLIKNKDNPFYKNAYICDEWIRMFEEELEVRDIMRRLKRERDCLASKKFKQWEPIKT